MGLTRARISQLPEELPQDVVDRINAHLGGGFLDFYATHLPFDPRAHVEMGALVLAGIFIFSLLTILYFGAATTVESHEPSTDVSHVAVPSTR